MSHVVSSPFLFQADKPWRSARVPELLAALNKAVEEAGTDQMLVRVMVDVDDVPATKVVESVGLMTYHDPGETNHVVYLRLKDEM